MLCWMNHSRKVNFNSRDEFAMSESHAQSAYVLGFVVMVVMWNSFCSATR